jgi:hypothetical protein
MTVDGVNPTIGATEATEMEKEETNNQSGQFYNTLRRKVVVVSFQGKDSDSRVGLL